jgi:hypothetical protein
VTEGWWNDDEQLLQYLGDAVRSRAEVPDHFSQVAKEAFAWRGIDAELAELAYDSSRTELAGARGDRASVRTLTFATGQLTIEVEATPGALRGQLVPPQPGELEMRGRDGTVVTVDIDEVGWFVLTTIVAGPFQLVARTESGRAIRTGWITL